MPRRRLAASAPIPDLLPPPPPPRRRYLVTKKDGVMEVHAHRLEVDAGTLTAWDATSGGYTHGFAPGQWTEFREAPDTPPPA